MATVLIAPVATQTKGGYPAEVTGIDPTDHDYLIGTIDRPGLGKIGATWNDVGICCGETPKYNLDMRRPEVANVVKTAKKLGA
jgi:hypothetical protein